MAIGVIDTQGHWLAGSSPLYVPSYNDTQIDHESVQGKDTGRTEDGYMHIDWVRRDVVKVYLKWPYLTGAEVRYLRNLLHGKEFTLTYYDAGQIKTAHVYCTKMTYMKVSDEQYSTEGGLYKDIQANCIEL